MLRTLLSFALVLCTCCMASASPSFESKLNEAYPSSDINKIAFTVSGKITSDNGEPLVGASIVEKGTSNGAITDLDGNFKLDVSSGKAILVVSFVGYETKEVALNNQSTLELKLSEGSALNEVVVVGYGTQKKSQLTGAISSISAKQITEMPITNVAQALQGRVAGVDVSQSGSKPGTVPTIRVRGRRSFRASNDPLYVIDGIPISANFEDLNPNDVASMEILKDATATAIYGARGANGVILISTKRGSLNGKKKTTISYDTYIGQTEALDKIKLFSGPEFAEYIRESRRGIVSGSTYKDAAGNPVPSGKSDAFADSKLFEPVELDGIANNRTTDYQDLILQKLTNFQNN